MLSAESIREQIAEAERKKKDAEDTLELMLPEYEWLIQRREQLKAELEAVNDGIHGKEGYIKQWKQTVADYAEQVESLRRELQRALEELRAQQRLVEREAEFDQITLNAPWREQIRPHQLEGARRMAAMRRGLLADKRGMGKSLTGYAWADMVQAKRLLVLAPRKSAVNLRKELERWAPHRQLFYLVGASKRDRDTVLEFLTQVAEQVPQFTVIVNLEAWRRDPGLILHLQKLLFDSVIIDEAHKVKEAATSMFKGARDIIYFKNLCPNCGKFSMPKKVEYVQQIYCRECDWRVDYENKYDFCSVKNVLLTTGSPIKNRPGEIWAQLYLLDAIGFPDMPSFKADFLRYDYDRSEWVWRPGGEEALVRKLGMRYLARTEKDAGIERLPVSYETVEVEFNRGEFPEQWKEYWRIQDEFEVMLDNDDTMEMTAIIAQLTRLQQAAIWPNSIKLYREYEVWDESRQRNVTKKQEVGRCPVRESAVMDAAVELIRDLVEEGHRIVVFSKYADHWKEMAMRLNHPDVGTTAPVPTVVLDGSTPKNIQEYITADFDQRTFNEDEWYQPRWNVLLTTYSAGGESLNFTAADQVILIEPAYNPENKSQAIGRCDRMGQLSSVTVHEITLTTGENGRPTCYQWLEEINEHKQRMLDGFEAEVSLAEMIVQAARNQRQRA